MCAFPSRAVAAPPGKTVAVLPVELEGEPGSELAGLLEGKVAQGLQSPSFTIAKTSAPSHPCTDAACIEAVANKASARYVVVTRVSASERDYAITLELYDAYGQLKTSTQTSCEICSHEEVVESLKTTAQGFRAAVAEAIAKPWMGRPAAEAERVGPARLMIRTEPAGAEVRIDGKAMGKTPLEIEVPAGPHDIELRKRGYSPERTWIRAPQGDTASLSFTLVESDEGQNRALKIVGWTLGVTGVAALGGGVTLLVLHHRPYENDCEGENVDFMGRCRYRYDTLAGGATMTAFGVAAIVTGITSGIILYGRKRAKESKMDKFEGDTVSVTPLLGPTSAGLRLRF